MTWLIVLVVPGLIALAYAFIKAPEGYQDATGFHYGKPDVNNKTVED